MRNNAIADAPERDYYTVPEVARLLEVSAATVWRWVAAGKLGAYRVGSRSIRIRKQDVQSVITPVRGRWMAMKRERVRMTPPLPDELARRQTLVERILERSEGRSIAPMTTADLVRQVRQEEMRSYGGS